MSAVFQMSVLGPELLRLFLLFASIWAVVAMGVNTPVRVDE